MTLHQNSISDEPDLICANYYYADRDFQSYDCFAWDPCRDRNDQEIYGDDCAYLWAEYNPYWSEDLLALACDESISASLPSMSGLTKIESRNPSMKWDFMWAHYWVVKRKIGTNGSWTTIYTYTVPLEPISCAPDTSWMDTSINLWTFENIVYYRVYGKVWTEESSSAPEIYWDCRPSME